MEDETESRRQIKCKSCFALFPNDLTKLNNSKDGVFRCLKCGSDNLEYTDLTI